MAKKNNKDTDLDVLSTKLDCLDNRLNRLQNDYDSTFVDFIVANRDNVESKRDIEQLKELQKLNSTDRDEKATTSFCLFLCKCLTIAGLLWIVVPGIACIIIDCFI